MSKASKGCQDCERLQSDIQETSRQLELMTRQRDKAKILMEHAISLGCRHIREARTLLELSAEIIEDERLKERIADFLIIKPNA